MWNAPRIEFSRFAAAATAKAPAGRGAICIRATLIAVALLSLGLALPASRAARADEMKPPRLSHINPDWNAVAADLSALGSPAAAQPPAAAKAVSVAEFNRATADLFPGIAQSTVPVLLPFDTAAYLKDRAAGVVKPRDAYLSGFHLSPFFLPGPAGYDAMFTAHANDLPELGLAFSGEIDVFVSGFSLLYDIDEPKGLVERPVKGLDPDFLGIRHLLLEDYARNTFERYGVPYVVSILCFDGGVSRFHMITCREAGKVAERFLKALRLAGGAPAQTPGVREPNTIARPQTTSPDFTYYRPGDIIAGTGFKGKGGDPDYTVYSRMRFPLRDAPDFANSQSFMNWGDCDQTGKVSLGTTSARVPMYRCRIGGPTLVKDESAGGNYAYPWRDNFCEHRYFDVGQCPGGLGHQGQDIRPSSCTQRFEAGACEPYQHTAVAVRDAMVLRPAGSMPVYLFVNAPDEHIRFRYLHMSPRQLDADGVDSGRVLAEGEEFGKVGSYFQHERATSYHLHFDMQVPTKYGWVFVNPYMTLVASYERLIGGRGTEIKDGAQVTMAVLPSNAAPTDAAPVPAVPLNVWPPLPTARPGRVAVQSDPQGGPSQGSADHGSADQVSPDTATGTGNPRVAIPLPPVSPGADREGAVRTVDRDVSRPGARTGHNRGNVLEGHARPKAGHHSL
jgi:hypothetical protein